MYKFKTNAVTDYFNTFDLSINQTNGSAVYVGISQCSILFFLLLFFHLSNNNYKSRSLIKINLHRKIFSHELSTFTSLISMALNNDISIYDL